MKRLFRTLFLSVLLCFMFSPSALPQSSGSVYAVTPMTRDLGALSTLAATGAGPVTSSDMSGFNVARVVCVFNQTTYSGSPSTTFKVQNKDAASGLYYDLIQSAAVATAVNTPSAIAVGAGLPVTTNVSSPLPVARTWRTIVTVGGTSTPKVTGTVGCSVQ